ncbi:hypothetical protein [Cohnella sp. GCM10012308]
MRKLLEKLYGGQLNPLNLRSRLETLDMLASFEYGFQLGASLIIESISS